MKKILFLSMLLTVVQSMSAKDLYVTLSNGGKTATIYYDNNLSSRGGYTMAEGAMFLSPVNNNASVSSEYGNVTTAVIDASVAEARPSSLTTWFMGWSSLTTITGLEYLNTEETIDMDAMFHSCTSLKTLDLTSLNTANVTSMEGMFSYCSALQSVDLSSFNTAKVTSTSGMFAECTNLKTIYADESRWSMANVSSSSDMFWNCNALVGGNGTKYAGTYKDNADYARIDKTGQPGYLTHKTGPATTEEPAANAEPYAVLSEDKTVLTFYYDGQKASRGGMSVGPFENERERGWNSRPITSVVFDPSFANCTTITSTAYWFSYLSNLTLITGLQYLKTDNVTDMGFMFFSCYPLATIDLSGFNTSNVTNMSCMFGNCVNASIDVSNFNTANVTDMSYMFGGCYSLKSLDVSNFNTSNVTNMNEMFRYLLGITELDISSFKTDKVTTMDRMFYDSQNLVTIYVGDGWSTKAVTSSKEMFGFANKIKGGAGTTYYSTDYKDCTIARVDGGSIAPGYFTAKVVYDEKCATPTISLKKDGRVEFACETEGVEFLSGVKVLDEATSEGASLKLPSRYEVTVIARKNGYGDSEKASLIVDLMDMTQAQGKRGDVNGDGNVNAADVVEIVNMIMSAE